LGENVLWITIIIAIEACVGIDISKKIKWFIMNVYMSYLILKKLNEFFNKF
jgi:hypothetical protein